MKKQFVQKVSDLIVTNILEEIGDGIATIDADTIDAMLQKGLDDIETQSYEKILDEMNSRQVIPVDKWWDIPTKQ